MASYSEGNLVPSYIRLPDNIETEGEFNSFISAKVKELGKIKDDNIYLSRSVYYATTKLQTVYKYVDTAGTNIDNISDVMLEAHDWVSEITLDKELNSMAVEQQKLLSELEDSFSKFQQVSYKMVQHLLGGNGYKDNANILKDNIAYLESLTFDDYVNGDYVKYS